MGYLVFYTRFYITRYWDPVYDIGKPDLSYTELLVMHAYAYNVPI